MNMNKRARITAALMIATLSFSLAYSEEILAFCGFYAARADTKLVNEASRVALVRDENRTVLTMANDYKGEPRDFALVIPVPTFIKRSQINVADPKLIDHLDAYTAPRLVEYFDNNPCDVRRYFGKESAGVATAGSAKPQRNKDKSQGVLVEARYQVGEYDIVILSAKESRGLESWLKQNGYRIPEGAGPVLGSYIRQNLRFFVARVNLKEQAASGFSYLRPLQVAYESPKFMLPIRLGTVNANGPQELFVFALTRKGRIETANYRTVRMPTGNQLPVYVKQEFSDFYRDMFANQTAKENNRAVFLEYAWDMSWCDPCAADPLSNEQLRKLGVFWIPEKGDQQVAPRPRRFPGKSMARDAFVTRLHLRYTGENFPEDLVFQQTGDKTNFQGRYVLRHPYKFKGGKADCSAGKEYVKGLPARHETEAKNLASLTGWKIEDIRAKMKLDAPPAIKGDWWDNLWN